MPDYGSLGELEKRAEAEGKKISEIVSADQAAESGVSEAQLFDRMKKRLAVMEDSVNNGIRSAEHSASGLSGGNAAKMKKAIEEGKSLLGEPLSFVIERALAVAEHNACMGRIVAAPTAGSCGILPASLLTIQERKGVSERDTVMALFTASGIGLVIARRACIAGATGGCQAECGSAAAMAAGAVAEMAGGTPGTVINACALALKNSLGLVCDPIAGLVEVPCVKRNAVYAVEAVTAAEMALAGIESVVPADEVVDTMGGIGRAMPSAFKETACGGLAVTPTGKRIQQGLIEKQKELQSE